MSKLDADARHSERSLRRLGKWLSPLARAGAERNARQRLEGIRSQIEEGDARQPEVPVSATDDHRGRTTVIEVMVTQELGDPFRRDALKYPNRLLDKYKHTNVTAPM